MHTADFTNAALDALGFQSIRPGQTPEQAAAEQFRRWGEERRAKWEREHPIRDTQLTISALGADWECRVTFRAEKYDADEGGGWGIDIESCQIRPADMRVKSDWIDVDWRELDMQRIEDACVREVE